MLHSDKILVLIFTKLFNVHVVAEQVVENSLQIIKLVQVTLIKAQWQKYEKQ